ncbi:MAG: hypothetical protein WAW96_04420 [Alphaproteobacteria bacterium]
MKRFAILAGLLLGSAGLTGCADMSDTEALGTVLGTAAALSSGYSGSSYSSSSSGGSGSSSQCSQLYNNAQTCYRSWKNLGGGTTGQAGAERDCYYLYNNAYNAQCR